MGAFGMPRLVMFGILGCAALGLGFWLTAFTGSFAGVPAFSIGFRTAFYAVSLQDNSTGVDIRISCYGICAVLNETRVCTSTQNGVHAFTLEDVYSNLTSIANATTTTFTAVNGTSSTLTVRADLNATNDINGTNLVNLTISKDLLKRGLDLQHKVSFPMASVSSLYALFIILAAPAFLLATGDRFKRYLGSDNRSPDDTSRSIKLRLVLGALSSLACVTSFLNAFTILLAYRSADAMVPVHVSNGKLFHVFQWISFGLTLLFAVSAQIRSIVPMSGLGVTPGGDSPNLRS
ncbi:hypothetical protein P154DRAFT_536438 [Amniculicola lignicola CBS 123094]|uniref:Uncharacterized protein n=1 Tax=Amniculicola lignicola CBS 123094 TaxID=1392246 RepID=A0A6A5W9X8_9PLEO|nr:hypothetical protein P154DRAFT_536438 [Amniculicola lignicola CBS 123094]